MQNTLSVALSLLEQLNLSDRFFRDGVPLPVLNRVAAATSLSTTNSLEHIRDELRLCISTSLALLSAIERTQMSESRLLGRCAHPASAACEQALALIRHEGILRATVEDMRMLKDVLDNAMDAAAHSGGGHSSLLILLPTIQVHEAALHTLLLYTQDARQAAAATVKAGRMYS